MKGLRLFCMAAAAVASDTTELVDPSDTTELVIPLSVSNAVLIRDCAEGFRPKDYCMHKLVQVNNQRLIDIATTYTFFTMGEFSYSEACIALSHKYRCSVIMETKEFLVKRKLFSADGPLVSVLTNTMESAGCGDEVIKKGEAAKTRMSQTEYENCVQFFNERSELHPTLVAYPEDWGPRCEGFTM